VEGTTFDPALSACTADVRCAESEIVRDGLCLDPLELRYDMADIVAPTEPAAFPGVALPLPEAIGESLVFAGVIGEPNPSQKVDRWYFTGEKGDVVRITVHGLGPIPMTFAAYSIDGTQSLWRTGPRLQYSPAASRTFVLPASGRYHMEVAPLTHFGRFRFGPPIGSPDARYVGVVERLPLPAPRDLSAVDPAEGELDVFDSSLFRLRAAPGTVAILSLNASDDEVRPAATILSSAGVARSEPSQSARVTLPLRMPATGDALVLVDSEGWLEASDASFALSFATAGPTDLGSLVDGALDASIEAPASATLYAYFDAPAGVASWDIGGGNGGVAVYRADGQRLAGRES
jgi:hypothetical protein